MRDARPLAFLALLLLTLPGCDGGGGGGGGGGSEDEPNDDLADATVLGPGAGTFEVSGNACNDDLGLDYFRVTTASAGTLNLAMDWNETDPDDDLEMAILDADGFPLESNGTPPAGLSTTATAATVYYLEVACFGGFEAVPYEGIVTVP